MSDGNAVDLADVCGSRCCRVCIGVTLLQALVALIWPATYARMVWRAAPTFQWEPMPALFFLLTGVPYANDGDDLEFECGKRHCPAEMLRCLTNAQCRSFATELYVSSSCSRELTRERVFAGACQPATEALASCLENAGEPCVYATRGMPAVVHRAALAEDELLAIEALGRAHAHDDV